MSSLNRDGICLTENVPMEQLLMYPRKKKATYVGFPMVQQLQSNNPTKTSNTKEPFLA